MKKNKIIVNILFIMSIFVVINLIFEIFFQKNVFSNCDFACIQIKNVTEYNVANNSMLIYLKKMKENHRYFKFYFKQKNEEKGIKYSEYLNEKMLNFKIVNIKKSIIGNVYVIYYKLDLNDENVERAVLRIDGIFKKNMVMLYDSIYYKM